MADEQPEPEFELVRVAVHEDGGFGVLKHRGLPFVVTLERTFGDPLPPFDATRERVAEGLRIVIPPGEYQCRRTMFRKGGYPTYEVLVPGHDRVLFHIGNLEEDSTGCILVGLQFGPVGGKPGVLLSRLGFREFMKRAAGRPEFQLRVQEVPRV